MSVEDDRRHMRHALGLGARGLGRTWPNPAVGCVIVKNDRIVGRGWTQPGGRPHAEVVALAQAERAAQGATAYVTLEPCAHHGTTPPCAGALIAAGIGRVVIAMQDPDPRVAGRGSAMLRAAGVAVTEGLEESLAKVTHAGFLQRITLGLPFVTLKLATSLDGRIATATGESRWITGPLARRQVHAMRLSHDAVMIGAGTARADDPELTVRDLGAPWQPVRIVVDTLAGLDPMGRLGQTAADPQVWICHGPGATPAALAGWQERGARTIESAAIDGRLDAISLLRALGSAGLTRVFCEGGGQLAASLLAAGLVNELVVFGAGLVIGKDGLASVGRIAVSRLAEANRFELIETIPVGNDVMTRWRRPILFEM